MVTQAAWRKYPNPMNPSVVGIDVVERRVDGGVLSTHRLIGSQWGIPGWIESVSNSTVSETNDYECALIYYAEYRR